MITKKTSSSSELSSTKGSEGIPVPNTQYSYFEKKIVEARPCSSGTTYTGKRKLKGYNYFEPELYAVRVFDNDRIKLLAKWESENILRG